MKQDPASDHTLRIGYIGAGGNTRKMHLPGFAAEHRVVQEVVANRSEDSARKVAEAFGIRRTAAAWRDVVEDPEVDAVCIGTWPYLHHDISVAALRNGKHVLCEARMAMNLAEARQMEAVAREHPDLVFQIVPAPFTLAYDEAIQRLLRDKALGRIVGVAVVHATNANLNPDTPLSWRQDADLSGENILTMGIFQETIHRWLGHNPSWLQATAFTATPRRADPQTGKEVEVQIPDAVFVTGQYDPGCHFNYAFSSLESGPGRLEIRLLGSEGSLVYDGLADSLTLWSQTVSDPLRFKPNPDQGWQVERDFVRSIREGAPVRLTSPADGVAYMAFTDAVQRSIRHQGARTAVPE